MFHGGLHSPSAADHAPGQALSGSDGGPAGVARVNAASSPAVRWT